MSSEIALDYTDVLKAYQNKSTELLGQLITSEAKLNASAGIIKQLNTKIEELTSQNKLLVSRNNLLESQKEEVSRLGQKLSKSVPKPSRKSSTSKAYSDPTEETSVVDTVIDYNS